MNTSLHTRERWLPVVGWEEIYEISNLGRLRHIKTNRINKAKPSGKNGYISITLKEPGRKKCAYIHSLVLRAFKGRRPSKRHECLHDDGNGSNNEESNLHWGTRKENAVDRVRHKRGYPPRKFRLGQVRRIKRLLREGGSSNAISKLFDVSPQTIANIRDGKAYTDVYL